MAFGLDTGVENVVRIKVIGVGGGGNNVVNRMVRSGTRGVDFVAVNTDKQALNVSSATYKIQIGEKLTHGQGAGSDPEVGRKSAEESRAQISKALEDTDMVFITAGMGGGTGTGAAPVVARIAQEKGMLTIGIVTIPFFFEGEKKILKALDGAEEMSKYVDALLLVNNEQLTEIYADLNWLNAFGKADDTLSNAARSISELITCDGYLNLDFKDVKKTLEHGGAAIISTGYGEGDHRVTRAIEDALNSPLLKNKDIYGSKRLLFNLYFSRQAENEFKMGEATELSNFISNIDKGVDVIYGIAFDDTLGDKIKITILAAGFDLSIKEEVSKPAAENPFGPKKKADDSEKKTIEKLYGKDKVDQAQRARESKHYVILTPAQFDDDTVIENFEHMPAYNRDPRAVSEMRKTAATAEQPKPAAETAAPNAPAPSDAGDAEPHAPESDTKEIIW